MTDSASKATETNWNPKTLDIFLVQVQKLMERHELQQKELTETKEALREAQTELTATKQKLAFQAIDRTDQAKLSTAPGAKASPHFQTEDGHLAQTTFDAEFEKKESIDVQGSKSTYSPQPHQPQDLRALDQKMVQELLEEINSCIALLEE
jgi:Tfp pilus assembly protein PilE|tara:strand:+ start:965 stop:1417 length:453 start_codon:yes stop_codon:yes gene_type:complete